MQMQKEDVAWRQVQAPIYKTRLPYHHRKHVEEASLDHQGVEVHGHLDLAEPLSHLVARVPGLHQLNN
jgi:hypothetical protein